MKKIKKKEPNRIIKYMGSKRRSLSVIMEIIKKQDINKKYIYMEPFCGSSVVFLNLKISFRKYFLNDYHREVLLPIDYFKGFSTLLKIKNFIKKIEREYDIVKNREDFYNLRDYFNNIRDSLKRATIFFMLANSCMSNIVRFGPNGMNSTWGGGYHKYKHLVNPLCNSIEYISNKNIITSSEDFRIFFKRIEKRKKYYIFLDPSIL